MGGQVMKKLVTLLSVLAMTSAASGAIIQPMIVSYNGEMIEPTEYIVIGVSDTVGFDIWLIDDTGMKLMSLDALVRIDGLGTLDVGPDPVGGNHLTWPYSEGFNNWQWDIVGQEGAVATGSFMAGMGAGVLVDHFLLHNDEWFQSIIIEVLPDYRWGGTLLIDGVTPYSGAWGSATIVPEPTTIALFGIAGLAVLRRRRR
jgi:hypothetical protein